MQTLVGNKHPEQHRGKLMTTPVILCVDDESDVLDALQRVFIDEPYRILRAQSGEEGLALLKQSPVQLIIADYRMPGMNGADFLVQAHEIAPDCLNIMLSGVAEVTTVLELIESRVIYTFVSKPWIDDDLRLAIKRALEYQGTQREVRRLEETLEQVNRELAELKARGPRQGNDG